MLGSVSQLDLIHARGFGLCFSANWRWILCGVGQTPSGERIDECGGCV